MTQQQTSAAPVGTELDAAQADAVGGGLSCDAEQLRTLTESFKDAYDNLVDFASHVIERVAGTP